MYFTKYVKWAKCVTYSVKACFGYGVHAGCFRVGWFGTSIIYFKPMKSAFAKISLSLIAFMAWACSDSDSPVSPNSSIGAAGSGVLVDQRDLQEYKTMEIGGRVWMVENLNYQENLEKDVAGVQRDSSWCYKDSSVYCDMQGRLYEWSAAMAACPEGWELPSKADFDNLFASVGGMTNAADSLLSKGFVSQIHGGYYFMGYSSFFEQYAYFWTSDEVRANNARSVMFENGRAGASYDETYEKFGLSVRCVRK